ncbi:MAG: hypothetical protein COS14_06360 [Bacteroidetes bacterium CG02_land_8_20_14_3_00_31_25]|nr:MAG: hypothetical protein COS14_06360 [Bacteroidetes bacterium CG02_land_8_20_14_3_00_31_25]PIX36232.1 MAG: hypothetical protein COZ59_02230 [Bacteroidetes bacterium CG_4_8_14_3_um_filter_31_14]
MSEFRKTTINDFFVTIPIQEFKAKMPEANKIPTRKMRAGAGNFIRNKKCQSIIKYSLAGCERVY